MEYHLYRSDALGNIKTYYCSFVEPINESPFNVALRNLSNNISNSASFDSKYNPVTKSLFITMFIPHAMGGEQKRFQYFILSKDGPSDDVEEVEDTEESAPSEMYIFGGGRMTLEQQEAIAVLQEFYDYNKTLTPHGESWLQADITINRETQRNLAKALPLAIEAMSRLLTDPDTGLKGCWHCGNIEAHHIEYVIAVKAKGGTPMNMPVDCPYHYCPACGRKLEVEG